MTDSQSGDTGWVSLDYGRASSRPTLRSMFELGENGETTSWASLKTRLDVENDEQAIRAIEKRMDELGLQRFQVPSLSDIIDASSNGAINLGFGHPPREDGNGGTISYWDNVTRVLEVKADYSAALTTDETEAALIRELFPDETAFMDELLEAMANDA